MSTDEASETELEYWLANEDWYRSRFTRDWLARTPREKAVEVLARLVEGADPEPRSLWAIFLAGFASSGFAPSSSVAGKGVRIRKIGVRAALMLADLNDSRCVAPLARVFETNRVWQNKYHELIETALQRFLGSTTGVPGDAAAAYAADLRALAARLWESGHGRSDLTQANAELLVAVLRRLHADGDETGVALLRSITDFRATRPNQRWVQDHVRVLLAE
jgi:hypothetical protein